VFVAFNLLTGVANLLPLPNSDGYQAGKIVWQWLKPVASSQLPDAGSGRLINKLCWALVLVCVACAVEVVLTAAVGAR
jgi:Zn-dependent protease